MKRGLEAPLEEAISSKRGDSERKRIILELCSRGLGSREIARQVGGLTEGAGMLRKTRNLLLKQVPEKLDMKSSLTRNWRSA